MTQWRRLGVLGLAAATAGCSVSTASFNLGSGAGGAVVGAIGLPAAAPPPVPPAMGGFLEGAVGQRLPPDDRDRAYQAELDALASGTRKTWRGADGSFGFVAPAALAGADGCRTFTHTIYIGGRPLSGPGTGCPGPDGAWTVKG